MVEVLELARGRDVYVVCRRGNDSQLAVRDLEAAGLVGARDIDGGLEAWGSQVDFTWPKY
jgi:adenylyltransferase/sulfurtransferase